MQSYHRAEEKSWVMKNTGPHFVDYAGGLCPPSSPRMKMRNSATTLLFPLVVITYIAFTIWATGDRGAGKHTDNTLKELPEEKRNMLHGNFQTYLAVKPTDVTAALLEKVRVLCWIVTSPANLQTKAIHVKNTWGRRCNELLFFSSEDDANFPAIGIPTEEGRKHLTAKTMRAFKYIYDNHMDDADWFIKADDDTYVIVENLRLFLADKNPRDPVYYGHHFKTIVEPQGYNSGGAGYVLSKEALRRFGLLGYNNVCNQNGTAEDVAMGQCMQSLEVKIGQTYDNQGRSRFHCLKVACYLNDVFPSWYAKYDSHNGTKSGMDSISEYAISFHYVKPAEMWNMEFFTHHLKTFGIEHSQSLPKFHPYYLEKDES